MVNLEGRVVPKRWAQYYLGNAPSLVWLVFANVAAVLVGIRFYVETMPGVSTFLWPVYVDSPVAVFLMSLSLATLLPFVGRDLSTVPCTRVLAYLHTITFVWLVKMGLWTFFALNLGFSAYYPAVWAYFGIVATHLGFVAEAYVIPHYGATTRGALATALLLALGNDVADYAFDLHPPLRYEPTTALVAGTVAISVLSVILAGAALDRLGEQHAD